MQHLHGLDLLCRVPEAQLVHELLQLTLGQAWVGGGVGGG